MLKTLLFSIIGNLFGNFYYFPEKNKVKAKCWCFTFIFALANIIVIIPASSDPVTKIYR